MELKRPGLGKNDKLFAEGSYGPLEASVDFSRFIMDDALLGAVFKESADGIVSQIEIGKINGHSDMYLFPICYLYRHGIELYLKQLIHYGIQLKIVEKDKNLGKVLREHKLCQLWNKARVIVEKVSPGGGQDDMEHVERLIHEFHHVDSNGQNFRYSKTVQGASAGGKLPSKVDLKRLQKTCDGLFSFFISINLVLCACIDSQNGTADYC